MKKFLSVFAATSLAFTLLGAPTYSSASALSKDTEVQSYAEKKMTITRAYESHLTPPRSIFYNDGIWSGYLYLTKTVHYGDYIQATYEGTVCSGSCPMPFSADETK